MMFGTSWQNATDSCLQVMANEVMGHISVHHRTHPGTTHIYAHQVISSKRCTKTSKASTRTTI